MSTLFGFLPTQAECFVLNLFTYPHDIRFNFLLFPARRDTEKYKAECAARDRASLLFRRKEARIHRLEEANEKQRLFNISQENNKLEDGAREDVRKYIQECKGRRRMSLAYRAKEKRRHFEWERKQREKSVQKRHRLEQARALDSASIALARQRESAMETINNLRHQEAMAKGRKYNAF